MTLHNKITELNSNFVSHSIKIDRVSTCKFRKAQNLHVFHLPSKHHKKTKYKSIPRY